MPQMSPLYWFTLMIMFIIMLLAINTTMYFNKKYTTKSTLMKNYIQKLEWKW